MIINGKWGKLSPNLIPFKIFLLNDIMLEMKSGFYEQLQIYMSYQTNCHTFQIIYKSKQILLIAAHFLLSVAIIIFQTVHKLIHYRKHHSFAVFLLKLPIL